MPDKKDIGPDLFNRSTIEQRNVRVKRREMESPLSASSSDVIRVRERRRQTQEAVAPVRVAERRQSVRYRPPNNIAAKIVPTVAKKASERQERPKITAADVPRVTVKTNNLNYVIPKEKRPVLTDKKRPARSIKTTQYNVAEKKTDDRSAKKYRHELKYYINMRDYTVLKNALSCVLQLDEHSVNGGYHIRSLYFDDRDNSAFFEKLGGFMVRNKYRIRIYNASDRFIRFERKEKVGDYIAKTSMALTRAEYEKIIAGDIDFLKERKEMLAHDIYAEMKFRGLRPKVVVDYKREAFVGNMEDVRITFDMDLRSGMFDKSIFDKNLLTVPMFEKGIMVLEVKFNKYLPEHIQGVLNNAASAQRSAISKYLICRKYE